MIKSKGIAAVGAFVCIVALGCGGGAQWVRPGTSSTQLAKDQDDCFARTTVGSDVGASDPSELARAEKDFENCMRRKGYERVRPE